MIATGVTRAVDPLGRIVLPIELRRTLDIASGDSMEIFVDEDAVLFRKYAPGCVFCGESADDLISYRGKMVCSNCRAELPTQA